MSMAQRVHTQSGHEVEILLAFEVVEESTFAALKGNGIAVVGWEKEALFKIGDLIEAGHGLIVKRTDTGPRLLVRRGKARLYTSLFLYLETRVAATTRDVSIFHIRV